MAFQEDKAAQRGLEGTIGRRVLGVECPVRNRTGDTCKECERVARLWRQDTATSVEDARKRQAKDSYFVNIQKRDGEFVALKLGKKVAKSLKQKLERYKDRTGKPFGFANMEEGEWLAIHKSGEKPNFEYELEVLNEQAEPVTEDQVKAMHTLDNLTEDFHAGLLPLEDVASLNSGDSYEFRMVPIPTGENKAVEMVYRYYHWFCSDADILGGEDVDDVVKTGDEPPKEFQEYMEVGMGDTASAEVEKVEHQYTMDDKPECFGHFDGEDDCMDNDCDLIRDACMSQAKSMKKKKK